MAYFRDKSSYDAFEASCAAHCLHYTGSCPILELHDEWNQDQKIDPQNPRRAGVVEAHRMALNTFIPMAGDVHRNCRMFAQRFIEDELTPAQAAKEEIRKTVLGADYFEL